MEQRALDLSKGEADIAIRGGDHGNGALVGKKIAEVPWGIYASHSFLERYGQPSTPADIEKFSVVELVDEIGDLPAARWMKLHAPKAKSAARCSNIPGVHLAIKAGTDVTVALAVHRHLFEIKEIYGKRTAGIIKDTVVVPLYGRAVVDFVANQPGLTLFHCHIQHHMDFGFKALLRYA